ncbi:MAG TPA: hypothetical protein VFQ53_40745 [Kofleriaceae bacterium]|nr:hypothetical protein [Kofleriaceae bacterium]
MFLGVATLAACGDDDTPPNNPDGGCTGHLCPGDGGTGPTLSDPEGGNLIFEYIYVDSELQAAFGLPNNITTINRVMAYFMESQTPNANPLPTPGACTNLEATKGWPLFVGTPHVDLDIGTLTITGKNATNADVSLAIDKQAAGTDAIGRPHDIFYQKINPNADDFIKPDSAYTVAFGGSGTIPATTFNDAIYLANTFTVQNPGVEDNGPLVAGTDFPVAWTPATSTASDEVLGVTWLVDATGKPTHMCPVLHSAGAFTIPGSAITEFKAIATARGVTPTKMILLRNAIVHRLQRLPNGEADNQRRIDMLSVMCWAQLMDVN